MHSEHHQVPIWFFIGAILLVYGVLIVATGIYTWAVPPEPRVDLYELHADVWWGFLLVIIGLFYCIRFNPRRAASVLEAPPPPGPRDPETGL
jgi:hypothetical protein